MDNTFHPKKLKSTATNLRSREENVIEKTIYVIVSYISN